MTPLDHLRLWFGDLDEEPQLKIAVAIAPALMEDLSERLSECEYDFAEVLGEWLATPEEEHRGVGKAVRAAAMIDHAIGSDRSLEAAAVWGHIGESWTALKLRHLGPYALNGWAGGAIAERLEGIGPSEPTGRATTQH